MLACPNDAHELTSIQIESMPVDQCPACHGYWLHRGELETLGDHHHAHLVPIAVGDVGVVDSRRQCPLDATPMCQHEFAEHSGITIDQCPACQGVWLESDELGKIIEYLDSDAGPRSGSNRPPTLTQRILLFLYQLTAHPPVY
ncbi:MAG TPA: zf-TFIIB domain-containing protein [Aggregatilineales bacterium]|nr:zf-TFIIB domain-containing protein [Aggregatilineales bacterium]